MSNHELTVSSSSPSRFSLVLLEPGEIYFEDYLVYYHETRNPLNSGSGDDTTTTSEPIKGNLKICSKSVVFDPINFSYPLVKFSYKSIDLIELFNEEDNSKKDEDEYDYLYTIQPSTEKNNGLRQKCFAISCKQTINCKVNNKIAPYVLKKSENKSCKYYFELIFTNVNDSLDLLMQLHRASTLEYEDEDVMQQLILKSRLKRDFNFDVHQFEDLSKEQVQFEAIVNKINPLVANPGKIILTNMCLYYKPFNNLLEDNQTTNVFKIRLKQIKYVIKRRYHLKRVGCEIIFDNLSSSMSDSSSSSSSKRLPYLYLTFEDEATRDQFYTRLTVDQASKLSNLEEFNQENMLQRWRYGAISNFDYLMYLNNMADRSYNDLTQYPVFPWVLNDYSSAELDLTNPKSFRDLSKPIGALNEERLARLRQRYFEMKVQTTQFGSSRTANQEEQPTFLYGSHYSTPAFVLFYLVRQHPEWQLCLQNGRFDHPNRLFHSIEDTWRNCLTIDSDVKELLPEFYDLGDYNRLGHDQERNLESRLSASSVGAFLRNDLELELGVRSDGVRVNHVILPKWAHNSTCEFIVKMRDALESPHVSENLHKWIDLIFGYKQTGQEAIDANNLFYYLCYEGAVDLNSISDYSQRKSLEIQIQEFGQIPTQLFKTPHLPKAKQIGELVDLEYLSSPSALATSSSTNQSRSSPSTTTVPSSSNTEAVVVQQETPSPYRITASSFTALEVKLNVKMHKSQVNDLIFLDEHVPQSHIKQKASELSNKANLPLVCSVSNDNWIKIYSLHERSVFRSHNVANFSLSSVDFVQIWKSSGIGEENAEQPLDEEESANQAEDDFVGSSFESVESASSATGPLSSLESTNSDIKFTQTLLFLSCWDNSIYVYDMNYNRCIYQVEDSHDDAISRLALIKIPASRSFLLVTSSWDSSIKIWLTSPISKPRSHKQRSSSLSSSMFDQNFKLQFLNELSHDSAVLDFCLTRTHLASICEDGDVLLWRLNSTPKTHPEEGGEFDEENKEDEEYEREAQFKLFGRFARLPTQPSLETTFSFQYTIEHTNEMGKITDCRIIESSSLATLAICTSLGFVKIFNISTASELFSIRISVPGLSSSSYAKLNRLVYTNDYILAIDSNGYLYFVDLQQQGGISTSTSTTTSKSTTSSFLSHHIKLTASSLTSIAVYNDFIIACGDSDGYLHFLSLLDI